MADNYGISDHSIMERIEHIAYRRRGESTAFENLSFSVLRGSSIDFVVNKLLKVPDPAEFVKKVFSYFPNGAEISDKILRYRDNADIFKGLLVKVYTYIRFELKRDKGYSNKDFERLSNLLDIYTSYITTS